MTPVVSIIIVSMNKFSNLEICLPSIEKFTSISHKIYVVAYLFSANNMEKLRKRFPYIEIIESNEIRGFSENNNLALNRVFTKYTFILNDDTEFKEPVLEKLIKSLEMTPDATVMSPVIWNGFGQLLFCGRRKEKFYEYLLELVTGYRKKTSKYENGNGIFRSYNISGAAFLIYTKEFRKIGFFNERYFFCPEDIEVGELLNKNGKHCYVDTSSNILHYEGMSSKKSVLFYATRVTAYLGKSYFYGGNRCKRLLLLLIWRYKYLQHYITHFLHPSQHHIDYMYIYKNVYKYFKNMVSTKDCFIEEYKKISSNNP